MNRNIYLQLSNTAKNELTQQHIFSFLSLVLNDDRVEHIKQVKENLFKVKTDELDGTYTISRIAAVLYESEKERNERVKHEHALEPDIINITEFKECKTRLSLKTVKKLHEYALSLPPSSERAQCYTIAKYRLEDNETIAERFLRDHVNIHHAKRQAMLLVKVGRANNINKKKNIFGTIVFEYESKLP